MDAPTDSLHGAEQPNNYPPRARAPTVQISSITHGIKNPNLFHKQIHGPSRLQKPGPTGDYVMLTSPRGDRSHDATAPAPSSSSSSSSRRHMVDAETGGACGRVLEWEVGLPAAGELTPVSHHLIPPALAAAFRIDLAGVVPTSVDAGLAYDSPTSHFSSRFDEDDGEDEGEGETEDAASGGGGGRGVRGGKKARMVWTPELHHRFVEAVEHLGDKGAVPKAIVRLMNVEGLTRENVASHLQKYRLYLKRTRTAAAAATPPPPPPYFPRFGAQPRPDTANRSCAFVSCEKLGRE